MRRGRGPKTWLAKQTDAPRTRKKSRATPSHLLRPFALLLPPANLYHSLLVFLVSQLPFHHRSATTTSRSQEEQNLPAVSLLCSLFLYSISPRSRKFPRSARPDSSQLFTPPVAMAITIEELDATVRAFYEGRGDQVWKAFMLEHLWADVPLLTMLFSL